MILEEVRFKINKHSYIKYTKFESNVYKNFAEEIEKINNYEYINNETSNVHKNLQKKIPKLKLNYKL